MNSDLKTEYRENKKRCVFGTYEWADETVNIINGCKHNCKYCYSKAMAIRFKRKTSENWKKEEVRANGALKYSKKVDGTIMYPSSHDIHPDNLDIHMIFIERLLEYGNRLLIVSKPHVESVRKICEKFTDYKDKILFRFTIGSSNSKVLKFWEPGAPDYLERVQALKIAWESGYSTSVSCEPMLDNKIIKVVEDVYDYVNDAIWLGKANYLIRRLKINNEYDAVTKIRASELINWQANENIISLYQALKDNLKIKWKESIKDIVGIKISTERGLDI